MSIAFFELDAFQIFIVERLVCLSPLSLMDRELETLRLLPISPCQIWPGDLPPETSPRVSLMYKSDLRLVGS
jgi:hypothetical protein